MYSALLHWMDALKVKWENDSNIVQNYNDYPFKRQHNKIVRHTETIRRQTAAELFECVWPF